MEEKGGAGGDFLLISKLTLSFIHCRFCSADTARCGAATRFYYLELYLCGGEKNWDLVDFVPFKIEAGIETVKRYFTTRTYTRLENKFCLF